MRQKPVGGRAGLGQPHQHRRYAGQQNSTKQGRQSQRHFVTTKRRFGGYHDHTGKSPSK
jgi:hypothetical protein